MYPEGRAHIINSLVSVLPGIDCNDIKKTMSVFQVRHDTRLHFETYADNISRMILEQSVSACFNDHLVTQI